MNLRAEVVDVSACKRTVNVEVPAEVVRQEFSNAYSALSRYARVPGFRPGKVPLGVVRQKFQKEAREEVINHLVPEALGSALRDRNLSIASQPKILELHLEDGHPLSFKATVEVFPEFELKDYKSLPLTRRPAIVSEEEIGRALEQLQEQHAQLFPVEDRPARSGDHLTVKLTAREAGDSGDVSRVLIDAQLTSIELGAEDVLDEFTEHLTGMDVGAAKTFNVQYPGDHPNPEWAGKKAEYTAEIQSIHEKELPGLDDEFARSLGQDLDSLEALRDRIRTQATERARARAEESLRQAALDRLIQDHQPEVPESLVERQLRSRLRGIAREVAAQGIMPNSKQIDWSKIAESERERAVRDVQASLILARIAKKEGIDASDAEIQAEVNQIAKALRQSPLEVQARLTKDGALDTIRDEVRNRKALQMVIDTANVETE